MNNFNTSLPLSAPPAFSPVSNTSRRRPGRPLGSKNKFNRENSVSIPVILNVPAAVDLIKWVVNFAKSREVHLAILCGRGNVLQADLSRMRSQTSTVEVYGEPLTLISFTGMYLLSDPANGAANFFNVSLGRVNGNAVSGTPLKLITEDNVSLTAFIFRNPKMLTISAEELMPVESSYAMQIGINCKLAVVLNVEPGIDIIQSVTRFACTCSLKVSAICCNGLVSELDIGYSRSRGLSSKIAGNFEIISFSGTCDGRGVTSVDNIDKSFVVSAASHNRELISGIVTGMKAMSRVTLLVSASNEAP